MFEWTGDLDDDCVCRFGGMVAHVECMFDAGDPSDPDYDPLNDLPHGGWHASVSVRGEAGDPYLWHADAEDVMPKTGVAARKLCELVMRAQMGTWQPISTAPKSGKWIQLWWESVTDAPFSGYFHDGLWRDMHGYTYEFAGEPTHWQPLPPVPTGCDDDGHLRCVEGSDRSTDTITVEFTTYRHSGSMGGQSHTYSFKAWVTS